jgi:RNA binding exosome subunit
MSTIRIWCVTANHGYYGNAILCSRVSTDKEEAIHDCMDEVKRHTQPDEKNRLNDAGDEIVDKLMSANEYVQSDEGLRMVAELHDGYLATNFIKDSIMF